MSLDHLFELDNPDPSLKIIRKRTEWSLNTSYNDMCIRMTCALNSEQFLFGVNFVSEII